MKNKIILFPVLSLIFTTWAFAGVDEYREAVIRDWTRQERHAGRDLHSNEALSSLIVRAEALLEWARKQPWTPETLLDVLRQKTDETRRETDGESNDAKRRQRYLELRSAIRDVVLAHPDVRGQPLVFVTGQRFTCQMLHEYMSYYYQKSGMNGGGIYLLKKPGESFETESLTGGRFPKGVFSTLSLSYDAGSIYFAFADFSKVQPDGMPKIGSNTMARQGFDPTFAPEYMKQEEGKFHLFKMSLQDRSLTQLTAGPDDDFDPVELPDGRLVFLSTRRGGFGRCHGAWEPLQIHTLHWLDGDGSVHCLSWHETNEWHPAVMNDGRILYTRWDYVDRSASQHHGLWTTNPDGTAAAVLFGNYTYDPNACYQAKAVPGTNKILFVGGAHHLNVGGPLVMLDPSKVRYDPETGRDSLAAMEVLTPEVDLPEVAADLSRICKQYYHSPWPLSENVWLTAFSHEPLGGYLNRTETCGKLGLYYRDRLGNLELLYEDPGEDSCMHPIPVTVREKPRAVPSVLPEEPGEDVGTFVLSDVYESLVPFPGGRSIKELRIFQLLPKGPDHRAHFPPVGHPYAGNARLLLGTVPVEADGSAYFKVPARLPVYFQAVDDRGKAVQSMRSIVYLQPGENRGCIGCHEQTRTVQTNVGTRNTAVRRPPSEIKPGPNFTRPFSYPLFVQPVLDRNCVSCHSGRENGVEPPLTGRAEPPFTQSYQRLKPFVRWYEWLPDNSHRDVSTLPGEGGVDICPLTKILDDKNHENVALSEEDRRHLYLWLDFNVPFFGVYDAQEQDKQLRGLPVSVPELQ